MKTALSAPLLFAALLGACSAPDEAAGETPAQAAASADGAQEAPAQEDASLPQEFARTAWRAQDAEGARFVTYLDAGGTYRDFRNGDPFQTGQWEVDEEGRLCFTPEDENGSQQCWRPDSMRGSETMIVTSKSGRRVALERVEYPVEEDGSEEGDAAS